MSALVACDSHMTMSPCKVYPHFPRCRQPWPAESLANLSRKKQTWRSRLTRARGIRLLRKPASPRGCAKPGFAEIVFCEGGQGSQTPAEVKHASFGRQQRSSTGVGD